MKPRFLEDYQKRIVPEFKTKFSLGNDFQVPKIKKIVLNMGVGEAIGDSKLLEQSMKELSFITGQKPVVCKAKKDISNFKLRKGQSVGCKVTLRGNMMYEFLDRLISIALPRIRDFRGISGKSFDHHGNYSFGVTEQSIFSEVDPDKVTRVQGMDIVVVFSSRNKDLNKELLRSFGMPFKE
ncbi:MAG: 50S ribosomal protein L5 [Candidatus Gygaella obscura]|nr:50S ribosomal protein L5 [Candidatus Gygaella obscura]